MVQRNVILTITGLLAIAAFSVIWELYLSDLFGPEPNVVTLDQLEYSFDQDAGSALARLSTRPLLVTGVVHSTGSTNPVLLKTRYIMPVQAYLRSESAVFEGDQIRLYCRRLEEGGIIGGKPVLRDCSKR